MAKRKSFDSEASSEEVPAEVEKMAHELESLAHVPVEPLPLVDYTPAELTCPTCGTRMPIVLGKGQ